MESFLHNQRGRIGYEEIPLPASPGGTAKHDYEHKRCGACNVFLACEPLAGKRKVKKITERKTKLDWACYMEEIADPKYEKALIEEPCSKLQGIFDRKDF